MWKIKTTLLGLLVGAFALGTVAAWCAPAPAPAPAVSDNYVLGPGDRIAIIVFEHPEFGLEAVIRPDGIITHPFFGVLHVSGETPTELAASVTKTLKQELRDPLVTVSVLELAGGVVYVKGEVNSPGIFPATSGVTVARVINLALGLTLKANRQEAIIYTPQGEERKVDLTLALGEHAADYVVQPRETLVIPPVTIKPVTIIGEVGKPGKYSLAPPDDTVLDALLAAGWVGPNGDRQTALLVRDGDQPQRLQIAPLLNFQPGFTGPRLEAGDMLVVPHAQNWVTVWGAVGKPGKIMLGLDPTHVTDLIADAGLTADANTDTATLIHPGGQSVSVALKVAMDNPTDPTNLLVTAGDTLLITTRHNEVDVLGYVGHPGPVGFLRDDRLLDALTRAGGLALTGDLDKVTLLRPGQAPVTVSIRKLMREGDQTNNLPLQVGDTIAVAEVKHEIYVFGNVASPGKLVFEENDRVLDIIARVGLDKVEGAPWEAALIRRDPQNPKLADVYHVDLDKLMIGQKQDENYLVQNGDIFVVPKRHGTNWLDWVQKIFGFVGMIDIFGMPIR